MKVLGVGEIVLDKSCILQSYPEEGAKAQPQKVEYSIGGPVPAALILLSRLGAECDLVTSIGDDDAGYKLKRKLQKDNIRLIAHKQRSTKSNTVLVNEVNGSRTIIRDYQTHTPIVSVSKRLLKKADLVIFDRHEIEAFDFIMKHKRPDTKVVIDPSTEVSAKTLKMFKHADYPIVPVESLSKLRRHEDFHGNLKYLYKIAGKPVIITAGEKGALLYDGKRIQLIPPVDITCVDALGAGDIFRGAFGYGVMNNWDLHESTHFANVVAGLQCTKIGNGTAIPTKEEIFTFKKSAVSRSVVLQEIIAMAT
ncbi:carbohydrate kinase family protein [Candidatus Dojkabacteria bacterium]|uniref:Carbohydrate kinase family protein n=1 Tax=Candidatus Dojkabacteria bacterium TaxID=2099670 RepID=A0A955RKZ8_9BACT|nr:carbohydrate kinase family protein [Candidatus Dojkabacteria bacterium]